MKYIFTSFWNLNLVVSSMGAIEAHKILGDEKYFNIPPTLPKENIKIRL